MLFSECHEIVSTTKIYVGPALVGKGHLGGGGGGWGGLGFSIHPWYEPSSTMQNVIGPIRFIIYIGHFSFLFLVGSIMFY